MDPTLRGQTDQSDILDAIVARLIDQIPAYSDQNCWVSDHPVPLSHPGGDEFCTVSMGNGRFPHEFFTGGGQETLTEQGSIIIAPTVPMRGDRVRRRYRRIAGDENKSLLDRKRQILRAMVYNHYDLVLGEKPLLRDMPAPMQCTAPIEIQVGEAKMLQVQITIETVFDWDLSAGAEGAG